MNRFSMIRVLCSIFFTVCFIVPLQAQKTSISPYSSFGYGDRIFSYGASSFGMGGIYSAYMSPYGSEANFMNPAANLNLAYTSFNFEGTNNSSEFKREGETAKRSAGYVSKISLAFPMGAKFTGGFGFQPFSALGYDIKLRSQQGDLREINHYKGNGGVNSVHAYTSYKITPSFALGVRVNYLFGEINKNSIFSTSETTLTTRYSSDNEVYGLSFTGGVAYSKKLKNNHRLNIGINYTPSLDLTSNQDYRIETYLYDYANFREINKDLVYQNKNKHEKIKIPQNIGFGISYGEDMKWNVALQLDWEKMSSFKLKEEKIELNDRLRIAAGGYYIPKFNSYRSYFEKVTYRMGGFYESTPITLNGQDIKKYGITFGIGLPVGRSNDPSELNLGVELGRQGVDKAELIQESFANVKLSLTLNDTWFQKRKYD